MNILKTLTDSGKSKLSSSPSGKRLCLLYEGEDEYSEHLLKIINKFLQLKHKVVCFDNNQGSFQPLFQQLKTKKDLKAFFENGQLKIYENSSSKFDFLINELENCAAQGFKAVQLIEDKSADALDIHKLSHEECLFHELMLANNLLNGIHVFSIKELPPVLLNKILELYPYFSINEQEYLNTFYIPLEYHGLNEVQKELQIFNHKLSSLYSEAGDNNSPKMAREDLLKMKSILNKLAHDLKSPIRIANIMNTMLQTNEIICQNPEALNHLDVMAKSLLQAYERIAELEKLAQDINA